MDARLPAGASCGLCHLFSVCRSRFGRLQEDTECEHAPSLYRLAEPILNSHEHLRPLEAHPEADHTVRSLRPRRKSRRRRWRFGDGSLQQVLELEGRTS